MDLRCGGFQQGDKGIECGDIVTKSIGWKDVQRKPTIRQFPMHPPADHLIQQSVPSDEGRLQSDMQIETIPDPRRIGVALLSGCDGVYDFDEICVRESQLSFRDCLTACLNLQFPLGFGKLAGLGQRPGIMKLQGVRVAYGMAPCTLCRQRFAPPLNVPVRPVLGGCLPRIGLSLAIVRKGFRDQIWLCMGPTPRCFTGRTYTLDDNDHYAPPGFDVSKSQCVRMALLPQPSDGGGTVYEYAWYFWDGEDDVFDVKDLSGIGLCRNLKSFSAISMIGKIDVRTLLPFQRPQHLRLSTGIDHIQALLDLPALKEVRVLDDDIYDEVTMVGTPTRRIFETLKNRGVRVWVHWVPATEPTPPAFE